MCPTMPDVASCEDGLTTYWPDIGDALYPVFLAPEMICRDVLSCTDQLEIGNTATSWNCGSSVKNAVELRQEKEWTCDDCVNAISTFTNMVLLQLAMDEMIYFLQARIKHFLSE